MKVNFIKKIIVIVFGLAILAHLVLFIIGYDRSDAIGSTYAYNSFGMIALLLFVLLILFSWEFRGYLIKKLKYQRFNQRMTWQLILKKQYICRCSIVELKAKLEDSPAISSVNYEETKPNELKIHFVKKSQFLYPDFNLDMMNTNEGITIEPKYLFVVGTKMSLIKLILSLIVLVTSFVGIISFGLLFVLGIYAVIEELVVADSVKSQFRVLHKTLKSLET